MALDESTAAFLKSASEQGGPALHEMEVAQCREVFGQMIQTIQGDIQPIHGVEDKTIPGSEGSVPIRIYRPRDATSGALPGLMLFHGGGWVIGDLDTHDNVCRHFANKADVVVVSVDYRLAPENKFPAGHNDCIDATNWVIENADALGINPAKVAVTGDSAGGNLAAVVAQKLKGKIAFQLLMYPVTDFSDGDYPSREKFGTGEYFLSSKDMEWFGELLADPQDAEGLASPLGSPIATEDLSGLAPALTVTAGFDPLRDEGKAYADKLAKAGVASEYKCFEGTIHGFVSFPGVLQAGVEGMDLMCARLKEALS